MNIPDLAQRIRANTIELNEREFLARMALAFGQQFYEKTGCMFICGTAGEKAGEMPEFLFICPTFGADFRDTFTYRRWNKDDQTERGG